MMEFIAAKSSRRQDKQEVWGYRDVSGLYSYAGGQEVQKKMLRSSEMFVIYISINWYLQCIEKEAWTNGFTVQFTRFTQEAGRYQHQLLLQWGGRQHRLYNMYWSCQHTELVTANSFTRKANFALSSWVVHGRQVKHCKCKKLSKESWLQHNQLLTVYPQGSPLRQNFTLRTGAVYCA